MGPRKAKAATPAANAAQPAKKTRTSAQQGIAAAFAGAERRSAAAAAAEPVLRQPLERALLAPRLTDELSKKGDEYLQTWGEKCYTAGRDGGQPAASRRAAAAAKAAAADKEEANTELDKAGGWGWGWVLQCVHHKPILKSSAAFWLLCPPCGTLPAIRCIPSS